MTASDRNTITKSLQEGGRPYMTDVTLETVGFQHHANVKTRLFRVDQIEHINVRVSVEIEKEYYLLAAEPPR